MTFNKKQYKNIRVYHNPDAMDFEYTAFGIDTNNYLIYRRAIYNCITKEDMYLVDWLKDQGVEYTNLDFEEFVGKQAPLSEIEDNAEEFKRKFINRLNEATKRIVKERFERGLKYTRENSDFELKKDFLFDDKFGLFVKTDYGTYESKQFNQELGFLITMSLSNIDSLEEVKHEYEFIKDFIFEEREKLIDEFFKIYTVYKNEVLTDDPKEYRDKVCPKLEKRRDVLNLVKYNWLEILKNSNGEIEFCLSGDATWDEEHGFRFIINKNKEITVE